MSRAREFADLAGSADAGGITGKNMVTNGAMQVAQRGTSSTTLTTYATVDRFLSALSGNTDQLAGTQAQSTTAPDGFSNSYKIDCTTAETTVDADEFWRVRHYVEAQNLQRLKYGTSAAQSITLSFWVRSNVTGTYACNIYQPDGVRQITKTYAINSADTWEYKTITFAGDTSGTINNDNGSGLEISWFLMAGSTWTGTDSTSWGAYANGGLANGHAVNMASSTSNEWYITGVQLEVGEQATPFDHSESYGETLARCQRYCQVRSSEGVNYGVFASGGLVASNVAYFTIPHITTMRAAPSNSITGTFRVDSGNNAHTSFTFDRQTTHSLRAIVATSSITSSVGQLQADATNISTIISDAEL